MVTTRNGIEVAPGFPVAVFDRAYDAIVVRTPGINASDIEAGVDIAGIKAEITNAFQAVTYRHRRAHETALELADLVNLPYEDRAADWHYTAQTRLFEFYVSLHSTFESSFYGLYFAGSRLAGPNFAFADEPEKYRNITAGSTVKAFEAARPGDPLARAMSDLVTGDFHKELAVVRNVLAHRIAPGFEHRMTLRATVGAGSEGTPPSGKIEYELAWRGKPLDTLIPSTLERGDDALAALWEATADFFAPQP
ncbi:hypothetical protein ACWDG9_33400 [Streptomyces sp. NPDC001073]